MSFNRALNLKKNDINKIDLFFAVGYYLNAFQSIFLSFFLVFTGQKNIADFVDLNAHHISKSENKAFYFDILKKY